MSIEDDRIEGLKRRLYSNSGEGQIEGPTRMRLQKHRVLVSNSWEDDAAENTPVVNLTSPPKKSSFIKKALFTSFFIFIAAAVFAAYVFISGTNIISNNNIAITLLGPVSTPAGEELSLDVDVANKNAADLVLADLVITYPDGTRSPNDHVSPMITDRISIGTIPKGQHIRQTIKSVIFGEENSRKDIKVSLEYRIDGTTSIFEKEKDYSIFIGSSPIAVTVDSLKEVIPDQENQFTINITSNSPSLIKGLVFKAEYPFGFQFTSATPSTTGDNATWVLGDIKPGEKRTIIFKGKLSGGNSQQRVFNFYTGTADPRDKIAIGTIFVTNSTTISLKKPFLGADIALNDKSSPIVITHAGESVKGEITWQNNLDVPLNDAVIEARLTGPMLDKKSISGERGFYSSVNNTITWDKTTLGELGKIDSGGTGRVQFSFAALPPTIQNNSTFRRQSLTLDLTVHAKRLSEGNVPEEIVSSVSRTIQVSTDLLATSKLVSSIGPFQNTGPMPTQPDQPTTYTVLVSLTNTFNTAKAVTYTATLPSYVKWLGATYPSTAGVSYNADTRQITWVLGDISPGVGFSSSPKEFAYQVSFLPSISQLATTPIIISRQALSGKDDFTGGIIQDIGTQLDIKIDKDPAFKYGDEKVGGK